MGFKKRTLAQSKQDLIDVVKACQEATLEVHRIHNTTLIKNEIISVEPMKMPEGALFFLDYRPDEFAEEDAACRTCEKILVRKGEKMNGVAMSTHTLGHAKGGGVEYSCHVCSPPPKRRKPVKGSRGWWRCR
jgi:hypothetical protein